MKTLAAQARSGGLEPCQVIQSEATRCQYSDTAISAEIPDVSIVIVSWNATKYLQECLTSLFDARHASPFEVIVVDNASSDDSSEMVRRLFPEAIVIQNTDNLGFSRANNIGIRRARGRHIALVNSDVHVLPDCIDKLVRYLEGNPNVSMVGPRIIGRDGKLQTSHRGFPRLWNMFCRALALDSLLPKVRMFGGYLSKYNEPAVPTPVEIISGCFVLVRQEALKEVGLLDELFFIYGEDMDWCKRFWQAGRQVVFVPAAESIHYGGGSSSNAPLRFVVEKQKADLQYWRKHHSRISVALYLALAVLYHAIRLIGHGLASVAGTKRSASHLHRAKCSSVCLKWIFANLEPSRDVANVQSSH